MIDLEQAIRQHWSTDDALTSLVPASRVRTGSPTGQLERPYVLLSRGAEELLTRTSSGTAVWRAALRFAIVGVSWEGGRELARRVDARFDRAAFDLPAGRLLAFQRHRCDTAQNDDATWTITLEYSALVEHAAA